MNTCTAASHSWFPLQVIGRPQNARSMEWVVDVVLTLQREAHPISPAFQQLLPAAAVVVWAQQRHTAPTWQDICTRWACNRATAFRWQKPLIRARQEAGRA